MPTSVTSYAKSITALVLAVATALLGVYGPDSSTGHVLTVVLAVATAAGVWAVPNTPAE